jgi:predicted PurR-regulated permease PerM
MDFRDERESKSIARPIILFTAIVIALWMLHLMTSIVLPLLFAVFIAIIFTPLMLWFVKKGCGNG